MTGARVRPSCPHAGAHEGSPNIFGTVGLASGNRINCSGRASEVFGASFSATC